MSERIHQAWDRVEAALHHLEKTVDHHRRPGRGLKVAAADVEGMKKRVDHLVGLIEKRLEQTPGQRTSQRPNLRIVAVPDDTHE
jgi:hypothetical protein